MQDCLIRGLKSPVGSIDSFFGVMSMWAPLEAPTGGLGVGRDLQWGLTSPGGIFRNLSLSRANLHLDRVVTPEGLRRQVLGLLALHLSRLVSLRVFVFGSFWKGGKVTGSIRARARALGEEPGLQFFTDVGLSFLAVWPKICPLKIVSNWLAVAYNGPGKERREECFQRQSKLLQRIY